MHHSCVAVYTGGEDEGEVQEHGKQRDPDTLLRTNFSLPLLLVLTLHSHTVSTSLWQHSDPFCSGVCSHQTTILCVLAMLPDWYFAPWNTTGVLCNPPAYIASQ
jgi:hypothetical protein